MNNISKGVKIENSVQFVDFENYNASIEKLLSNLSFDQKLKNIKKVIIKPNLLQNTPHPCTTDLNCIFAVINFINNSCTNLEIKVIEGSGGCDTELCFRGLGYYKLKNIKNVTLIDVDKTELVKIFNKEAIAYKEVYLPKDIFDGFFISIPTLKDHLITTVTLGMKNLIGLLPEKYYGGYWSYKRSDVHRVGVNNAIVDLNTYITIDMVIIDGRIGQIGSHLAGGRQCKPQKNILIGGYDAFKVDCFGAEVLGHNWQDVKHLNLFSQLK